MSLFFDASGTTQMFPEEPRLSWLPGKVKVPQSKPEISSAKRPNHQLPETIIGHFPPMNPVPMSSAFSDAESCEMYPALTQASKVSAPYFSGSDWKSTGFLYSW